jgi:hypothetical protein
MGFTIVPTKGNISPVEKPFYQTCIKLGTWRRKAKRDAEFNAIVGNASHHPVKFNPQGLSFKTKGPLKSTRDWTHAMGT